jgi:ribosomal protein L32
MSGNLIAVRSMDVSLSAREVQTINLELVAYPDYDARELYKADFRAAFPGKVVVKCQHCGQWSAVRTMCKSCGAPVDD